MRIGRKASIGVGGMFRRLRFVLCYLHHPLLGIGGGVRDHVELGPLGGAHGALRLAEAALLEHRLAALMPWGGGR